MFFLWVNIIKIKKINKRNEFLEEVIVFNSFILSESLDKIGTDISLIIVTKKTVNDANIDETDEYLNIKLTTIHVKINNNANWIDNANNIPRYVATPLPPLNFSQSGKICPKKAKRLES